MVPTSISQIIEQIVNAIVSIAAASYLFSYGVKLDAAAGITNGKSGAIYGAAGSTLGTSLGAAAGLLFLIIVMLMYNRVLQKNMRRDHVSRQESYASTLRVLKRLRTHVVILHPQMVKSAETLSESPENAYLCIRFTTY